MRIEFRFTVVGQWVRLDFRLEGNNSERLKDLFMKDHRFFVEFLKEFFSGCEFRCEGTNYSSLDRDPKYWLNLDILWYKNDFKETYLTVMDKPLDKIAKFEKWVNTKLKPLLALLREPTPWKKFGVEKVIAVSDEKQEKIEIL
jgi:hypothetical protein